jgi:hypothetical protein
MDLMRFPRKGGLAALIAPMFFTVAELARADSDLTSPAIDRSIFKEGAVKSFQAKSGEWISRCDEIVQLKKRICNLVAAVRDDLGRDRGVVIVATDQSGKLNILIKLLTPIVVSAPIAVEASFPLKRERKGMMMNYRRYESPIVCSETCSFMFSADSRLLYALNQGEAAKIAALVTKGEMNWSRIGPLERVELHFSGEGFSQALTDAMAIRK